MDSKDFTMSFGLSRKERRGGFLLALIIFATGAVFLINKEYFNPPNKLSESDITIIDSILVSNETKKKAHEKSYAYNNSYKLELNPRQFDPNTVTYQELIDMGVPKRTVTIWINFREKGGKFNDPSDIQNIYTLDDRAYEALLPFTVIEESKRKIKSRPKQDIQLAKKDPEKLLFPFDPNTISRDSLNLLNVPPRLASSIIGYRKAGGIFRSVEKLKTSPGITDSIYGKIAPYVRIDSGYLLKKKIWKPRAYSSEEPVLQPINLNTADSIDLRKIRGIGAVRAKVILERRDNIGGYYHLNQLYDGLYSLDSTDVKQISKYLYVDDSYRRIDLKTIDKWTLQSNYYFNKNMATTAVNYFKHRDQRSDLDDFIANSPLSQEKWEKVKPYLTLDE